MESHRSASPYLLDKDDGGPRLPARGGFGKSVFFDGVFKGDYSLAIVNRQLARALLELGVDLTCHSSESEWQGDRMLNAMPDVRERMSGRYPEKGSYDVHLRNTWPPSTRNMVGRVNAYVSFAWEESELPQSFVESFNRDLDLVMVTSRFVADAFRHSGVTIPVHVIGNGCDHLLKDDRPRTAATDGGAARILHVSSGFARKGVDLLIEAFCAEFKAAEAVTLTIKTFPNPNNEIPQLLESMRRSGRPAPRIELIDKPYSDQQLIELYKSASMLVAPSRGEGFGLPLAEAMLLEVPVVTTAYGGQLDFCTDETAWLVKYKLEVSRAHVAGGESLWASADIADLGRQMRAVLAQPELAKRRSARAKKMLDAHFTWQKVARRALRALATPALPPATAGQSRWCIDLVSSWRQQCGIATYAERLFATDALAPHVANVFAKQIIGDSLSGAAGADEDGGTERFTRLWGRDAASVADLAGRLQRSPSDVLWIQHHPGHLSHADMEIVAPALARSSYRVRAITLHSVEEALQSGTLSWMASFDVAFVHAARDAALLSAAGLGDAVVIPHGFTPRLNEIGREDKSVFTIGSFGFLTRHKNVDKLLLAFARARQFCPRLRLKLINCARGSTEARALRAAIENMIVALRLTDAVSARFDFVPEPELETEMLACDLLVFPYAASSESATGAARIAMSADKPILCSRSNPLRDLWPISHVLKDDAVETVAEALVSLAESEDLLRLFEHDRRQTVERYSFPRLAVRYKYHLERLFHKNAELRHAA